LVMAISLICAFALPAYAEDVLLTAKVQSVTQATDRNGGKYVRVIVEEDRTLNGVSYKAGIPAMFFGSIASEGAKLKAGDTLRAIVSKREFNSRMSYTVNAVLPAETVKR